ncbi:MAG: hypothetical protein AB8I08_10045 [Sandaracinaceae bacterium]
MLLALVLLGCDGEDPCMGMTCIDAGSLGDSSMPDARVPDARVPPPDSGDGLLCSDTCGTSNDGECDDGGPDSLFSACALGTDCGDCGPRDPDVTCTPDCAGRACGPDGCGGSCAPGCSSGQSCSASGQCIDDGCVQECGARECGPDPACGVSCGSCEAEEACDGSGVCQCVPACSGRECGDDGCGGTCGAGCTGAESCGSDGRCGLEMRTWSGATANVRLIVGDLLSTASGRKVCLYGTDDDRPYMVLNRLGFSAGETVVVNATYVDVPAGIPLRVSHHITLGLADDTATGCNAASAVALDEDPLMEGRYYTVVARTYDAFFTGECAANAAEDDCEFYARSDSSLPEAACADQGTVLLEDGSLSDGAYVGRLRVANLTSNASQIGSAFGSGSWATHGNRLGGSSVGANYRFTESTNRMRLCPTFLECDPRITGIEEVEAVLGCTEGEAPWTLAEVTNSRFSDDTRATTVYVFGNTGRLNASRDGLFGTEVGIVVAHDVSDGALP